MWLVLWLVLIHWYLKLICAISHNRFLTEGYMRTVFMSSQHCLKVVLLTISWVLLHDNLLKAT